MRDRLSDRAGRDGRELRFDGRIGLVVEADRCASSRRSETSSRTPSVTVTAPVRLWARPVERAVELHVSDAGPGFPPEFLPHAFERFRRADTARSHGGTGLGLAIVKAIADAHGGSATARNANGGGADVWIELAAVAQRQAAAARV